MDEMKPDNILAFDTLYTTNHIQIQKLLLPCFDSSIQKKLAVLIKFQELQYTILCMKKPADSSLEPTPASPADLSHMLEQISPYCTKKQRDSLTSMEQIMQSFEMFKEFSQIMEVMKDIPVGEDGASELSPEDIMNLLKGGFSL